MPKVTKPRKYNGNRGGPLAYRHAGYTGFAGGETTVGSWRIKYGERCLTVKVCTYKREPRITLSKGDAFLSCTEFEFWDLLKLFKGSEVQAAIRDCRKIIKAQYGEVQYADMRVDPTPKVAQSRRSQALSKKVRENQPDPAQQEQEEQPTDSDADVFDEEEDEGETNDVAGQSQQQAA